MNDSFRESGDKDDPMQWSNFYGPAECTIRSSISAALQVENEPLSDADHLKTRLNLRAIDISAITAAPTAQHHQQLVFNSYGPAETTMWVTLEQFTIKLH